MNPFVNPKKRSISLPKGCKDLMDVLEGPECKRDIAIERFVRLVLLQAQQDHATELVIGPASGTGIPIRYKVDATWYDMGPFPSYIRPGVVAELGRMAELPEGPFPKAGTLRLAFGKVQVRWTVRIKDTEDDCELTRLSPSEGERVRVRGPFARRGSWSQSKSIVKLNPVTASPTVLPCHQLADR
jgi:hypothetical protein